MGDASMSSNTQIIKEIGRGFGFGALSGE